MLVYSYSSWYIGQMVNRFVGRAKTKTVKQPQISPGNIHI